MKHTISARWSANLNIAHSHFPHNFPILYDYYYSKSRWRFFFSLNDHIGAPLYWLSLKRLTKFWARAVSVTLSSQTTTNEWTLSVLWSDDKIPKEKDIGPGQMDYLLCRRWKNQDNCARPFSQWLCCCVAKACREGWQEQPQVCCQLQHQSMHLLQNPYSNSQDLKKSGNRIGQETIK